MSSPDHYNVLGVSKSASDESIKQAYRELALKHHPDTSEGKSASSDVFQQVQASYDVLSDPIKRLVYDRDRFGGGMSVRTSTQPGGNNVHNNTMSDKISSHYKPLTAKDVDNMFGGTSTTTSHTNSRVSAARLQSRAAKTSFAQRKAQRSSHVAKPASSIGFAFALPLLVASVWGATTWYSHSTTKERERKRKEAINRVSKNKM